MHRFRVAILAVAAVLTAVVSPSIRAQNVTKSYVIVVRSQNASATAAVAALAASRGTVTAQLGDIGVVGATSSDPDFAAVMAADGNVSDVGEDPQIQWLPNEQSIEVH